MGELSHCLLYQISFMEVGVKVCVEHPQTGSLLHVASAYLVFVAIDQTGRRVQVPVGHMLG